MKLSNLTFLIAISISHSIFAQDNTNLIPLKISAEYSADKAAENKPKWDALCQKLGKLLSDSEESQGLFAQSSCVSDTKQESGAFWSLVFRQNDKKFSMAFHLHTQGKSKPFGLIEVESEKEFSAFLDALNPQSVRNLVQLWLPYWSRVKVEVKSGNLTIESSEDVKRVFLVEQNLKPDFSFHNRIMASAKYRRNRKKASALTKWTPFLRGGNAVYVVKRTYKDGEKEALVQKAREELLSGMDFLKLLDSLLFDSLSSSLAGIRYGYPLISGGTIISGNELYIDYGRD